MLRVAKEPPLASRHESFPYQVETVELAARLEYTAIFHEQGLGKTKIAIDLALTWLKQNDLDSVVIVTKKSLVRNWEQEIVRHSHLKPKVLDQDPRTLFFAFNTPARLYLTHYEACKSAPGAFSLFLKTRRVGVICDESQKIKNPDSSLAQAMHKMAAGFKRRVIMSGTPIANRPYDLWSQIRFLDGGKSLGNDFDAFKQSLDLPSADGVSRGEFERELSSLFEKIKPFTVRKTKANSGIVLPSKVVENVYCDFETDQARLYTAVQKELRLEVMRGGQITVDDSEAILKRLLRLVQIASNPRLVDERYRSEPAKMAKLKEVINTCLRGTSKALVWTSFTENADWIAGELADYSPAKVHGKLGIEARNAAIERFKREPECRILVATPGAAKEGLTLTVANHAIFFDRGFSLDDYLQAQDRIHRISQTATCYIFNLIVSGSIDEWVAELLAAKHMAAQLGQGDIDRSHFEKSMSYAFAERLAKILTPASNP